MAETVVYQQCDNVDIDEYGRAVVRLATFDGLHGAGQHKFLSLVVDSGASVTTVNKITADNNRYKIIKPEATMLFGVNDKGIIARKLSSKGISVNNIVSDNAPMSVAEKKQFLADNGLSDVGLVYDLRVIPLAVFCGHRLENMLVATPTEDDTNITEVLAMNVLGRFDFGISLERQLIFLSMNKGLYTPPDPMYACGSVSLVQAPY
jgi:hypothetical protein